MKNIETTIVIDAPVEKVWQELTQHQSYPDWNPFIKSISGFGQVGETIQVTIQPEDGKAMQFTPKVLVNKQNQEFRWKGKLFMKGLFDGEHYFKLEVMSKNQTCFIHGEIFQGLLSGILLKQIGESTLKGFQSMNKALKKRVEGLISEIV